MSGNSDIKNVEVVADAVIAPGEWIILSSHSRESSEKYSVFFIHLCYLSKSMFHSHKYCFSNAAVLFTFLRDDNLSLSQSIHLSIYHLPLFASHSYCPHFFRTQQ